MVFDSNEINRSSPRRCMTDGITCSSSSEIYVAPEIYTMVLFFDRCPAVPLFFYVVQTPRKQNETKKKTSRVVGREGRV